MKIDEVKKLADSVDGYLQDEEGVLLYNLSKQQAKKGVIVEIGSWKGKSTVWIGKGIEDSKSQTRFYAIDPHTGSPEHKKQFGKVKTFEEFKKNIRRTGVVNYVTPLVLTSEEAVKRVREPISFIFIDGAHEYDMVKLDFTLWFPKVINGGIIAFHDTTNWPGPKKLVREEVYFSNRFKNVHFIKSITYGEKVTHNTLYDRTKHMSVLTLKTIYGNTSTKKFPQPVKKLGQSLLRLIH